MRDEGGQGERGGEHQQQQYLTTGRKLEDIFGPVRVQQAHLGFHRYLDCRCH